MRNREKMTEGREIIFATGNRLKFLTAQLAFGGTDFRLVQKEMEIPEVQDVDVVKIATFSAEWASRVLNKPVAVTDAGYYIESLNGFPGPFIKYVNGWFNPDDYVRLMAGIKDRTVVVRECLAFASPGEPTYTVVGEARGSIATSMVKKGHSSVSSLFIPEGFEKTEPEISETDMVSFWAKHINIWPQLVEYLEANQKKNK